MKKFFQILFSLIFVIVILFVMSRAISWQDALAAIHALSWTSIFLIMGFVLVIGALKATRFFFILRYGKVDISWKNTVRIFIASQIMSPIPAGEVGRAMLFKRELDIHLSQTAGPVFLQALMELWTATLWILLSVFFVGFLIGWWIVGLIVLLVILSAPLLLAKQLAPLLDRLKRRGFTAAWIEKIQTTFEHFEQLLSAQGKSSALKFWILIVGLGLLVHAVGGGLLWYIAHLVGAHLTLLQGIFAAAMAALIQGIFTIIPGGLGVTEGGLVGVISSFGIPWQMTIAITLLYRIATLPLTMLVALCFLLPIYGKKILALTSKI